MQRIETTYNVNTIFERLTSTSSTLQPINKQLIILSDIERLLISIHSIHGVKIFYKPTVKDNGFLSSHDHQLSWWLE